MLKIGEYYTGNMPGLSVFSDLRDAFLIKIGWQDKAGKWHEGYKDFVASSPQFGESAPDDSYHRLSWKVDGTEVSFDWGKTSADAAIGLISANAPVPIRLTIAPAWPGSVLAGSGSGHSLTVNHCSFVTSAEPYSTPAGFWRTETVPSSGSGLPREGKRLECELRQTPSRNRPVLFAVGTGELPELSEGAKWLAQAGKEYEQTRSSARGDWGDFVGPISNEMGHSRVFSPDNGRISHIVSRNWCLPDGQVLFCWDSFFNGVLASIENPEAGRQTVRAVLNGALASGFVPNFSGRGWGTSSDRSQPPVGALCVWKMYNRDPDKKFLAEVYPKLVRWHDWWFSRRPNGKGMRNAHNDGLFEWGSETGDLQNAKFESGLDDSPMFDTASMSGPYMTLDSVDLTALFTMDSMYLAKIADILGRKGDASDFRIQAGEEASLMNEKLWNEEAGVYQYRYWEPYRARKELPLKGLATGFRAEYFSGRNFEKKVGEEQEPDIDFTWTGKSPFKGLTPINFSVRWTGSVNIPAAGPYVFTSHSDDGVRLWLDGKLLIDDWKIHGNTQKESEPIELSSGGHELKVEYFQAEGDALIKVDVGFIDPSAPAEQFYNRLAPLNFYPMIAGAPSKAQAKRMLELFFRPDKFGGEYMCPTISRDDPAYPAQGYWRGTIWGPTNYLIFQGLRRYGTGSQRAEFARKSVALFMKNWNHDGTCHENFNAMTGWGRSDPHYTWGALLCLIGIEDLCDIEPDGRLRLNGNSGVHVRIQNFHIRGKTYELRVEPHEAELMQDGRVVYRAEGIAKSFP